MIFMVDKYLVGNRLDKVVVDYCKTLGVNITRSGLKSQGIKIYVNEKLEKLSYIVKEKDKIEFQIPEPQKSELKPENIEFEVLYSDNDIAVINKPAGLPVHIGAGHKNNTLVNGLLYRFEGRLSSIGGIERPGIVHRLDKDTSGLMVVALSEIAHQKLTELFKQRLVKKVYYAVVKGYTPETGKIELPISRSSSNRKKMAVNPKGKEAITIYKTLAYGKETSLVEVEIKTGRTHQIRVHFSHIGHPILGDPIYSRDFKKYKLALIAKKLAFNHPVSGDWLEFEIPFTEDFLRLFKELEIEYKI
ncbi:MAG: RluA family pseudouridine synthase [Brevinematales bacterium]|nr:RluA family pseudouridine synthase [Brevinematales bacterium]